MLLTLCCCSRLWCCAFVLFTNVQDPEFRRQFQIMTQKVGVDPLASNKGFWGEILGVGDFYYDVAVQIVDICMQTRDQNGGLIDILELGARLVRIQPTLVCGPRPLAHALTLCVGLWRTTRRRSEGGMPARSAGMTCSVPSRSSVSWAEASRLCRSGRALWLCRCLTNSTQTTQPC